MSTFKRGTPALASRGLVGQLEPSSQVGPGPLSRFLLWAGPSRLKTTSWSLSSSDSDSIRLQLCSVLRCLTPEDSREDAMKSEPGRAPLLQSAVHLRTDLLNCGFSSTLSCSSMLSRMVYLVLRLPLVRLLDTQTHMPEETWTRSWQTRDRLLSPSAAADEGPAGGQDREDEQEAGQDDVEDPPL